MIYENAITNIINKDQLEKLNDKVGNEYGS